MKSTMKSFSACLVLVSTFLLMSCENNTTGKVGYVLTQKVFSEFRGTKEMEKKFSGLQERQKYLMDSMALEINTLEAGGKTRQQDLASKKETFNRLLTEFKRNNAEQDREYTEGLWKQINQYVSEYGKEKKLSFIYGADGTGNIMYADSTFNITDDVVKYMNEKYEGK